MGRFSRLAMVAVALLLLSGIVQSIVLVGAFDAFVETAYGRLVLAKIALFLGLISLGAYNQRRLLPRLRTGRGRGEEPERAAALLRRSVACEVGLALVVLGLASVLVATEPAVRPSGVRPHARASMESSRCARESFSGSRAGRRR